MATIDTILLERQIGGAEVRETLRPIYRDVAALARALELSGYRPLSCPVPFHREYFAPASEES